jgi:hypothetical protein
MAMKENAGNRALGRKVKETYTRVQEHVQKHKRDYAIGVGGATGGFAIGLVLNKRPIEVTNTVAPVINIENACG